MIAYSQSTRNLLAEDAILPRPQVGVMNGRIALRTEPFAGQTCYARITVRGGCCFASFGPTMRRIAALLRIQRRRRITRITRIQPAGEPIPGAYSRSTCASTLDAKRSGLHLGSVSPSNDYPSANNILVRSNLGVGRCCRDVPEEDVHAELTTAISHHPQVADALMRWLASVDRCMATSMCPCYLSHSCIKRRALRVLPVVGERLPRLLIDVRGIVVASWSADRAGVGRVNA